MRLNLLKKSNTKGPYIIKASSNPFNSKLLESKFKSRHEAIRDALYSTNNSFLANHFSDMQKKGLTEIRKIDDNTYHFFYKNGKNNLREEWRFNQPANSLNSTNLERKLFSYSIENNVLKTKQLEHQLIKTSPKSTPLINFSLYQGELKNLFGNLKEHTYNLANQLPKNSAVHNLKQSIMSYELDHAMNSAKKPKKSFLSKLFTW